MVEDRKLFVAGLPDSVSEDVLRQLFEATGGDVVEVSLPKDRATGRPRGFGFVTMATSEQAESARQSLDGSFQGGKSISVRPFQAEPPRRDVRSGPPGMGGPMAGPGGAPGGGGGRDFGPPGGGMGAPDRTLYVGNLPYDASIEEVEGLIGGTGAGPVVRVHLPMDPDGRKRGFGFVTMASAESAKEAIEALRGLDVRGRRLVVNLAHPKGERPAREERPGGYGPPAGGGGPPPGFGGGGDRFGGPPAPPPGPGHRKHDDKRRRNFDDGPSGGGGGGGGGAGAGGAGGGGGRRQKNWDPRYGTDDDWDE